MVEVKEIRTGSKDTFMKEVYQVMPSLVDKIKTNEDLHRLGRKLSPIEVEEQKKSYIQDEKNANKEGLVERGRIEFKYW